MKVKFDIIPETNKEYISVTYGCIRFIDSYRFISSSYDSLVKTLVDNSHKTFENWKKKLLIKMKYQILLKTREEDKTIKDFKKGLFK